MSIDRGISEETIDRLYIKLMPRTPDPRVERAAGRIYAMIRGYADFLNLEEAINGYSAATERRGFKEGLLAGMRRALDEDLLKEVDGLTATH